jgi:hypothetical protein
MFAVDIKNGIKSYKETGGSSENVLDGIDMTVRFGEM